MLAQFLINHRSSSSSPSLTVLQAKTWLCLVSANLIVATKSITRCKIGVYVECLPQWATAVHNFLTNLFSNRHWRHKTNKFPHKETQKMHTKSYSSTVLLLYCRQALLCSHYMAPRKSTARSYALTRTV